MLSNLVSTFTRMVPYRFSGKTVACPLCDGMDHEVVGSRDRYGHRLRTVLCRACGLVFTNPMPIETEVALYYRRSYRQHYHNATTPPAQWLVFPDNYALLSRFFREHTNAKYFLTLTCYTRWVRRMIRLGSNMLTVPFVRL